MGENLAKALEWFQRAIDQEARKNDGMMNRCLDKAIEFEKAGIAAGEHY